jgi:AcrR family transcriptional regulator
MAAEGQKKARRNNATAQRILAAAFKCIAEKGSAKVSLRDIAEEAGVVLSQLNYYFVNREQLFAAVLRMMKQEYLTGVEAQMTSHTTLQQKAHALITYNRDLLAANQAIYRAFLDFFGLALWSPSFQKELNEFLDGVSRVLEIHMETATSATSSQTNPHIATLTNTILATTFGIAMQYLMNPERVELLNGFDLLNQIDLLHESAHDECNGGCPPEQKRISVFL